LAYYLYAATLYIIFVLFLPLIILLYFVSPKIRIEAQSRVFDAFKIEINREDNLPTIWFHASSIGEMKVATHLIDELKKERNFNAVLSVFTRTALKEGKNIEGLAGCFLLPFDFPCILGMTVKKVQPDLLVTIESEFWLSLLHKAKKQGAKIALANGRVSEKAFANHGKYPLFIKTALGYYNLVLARSKEDLERLTPFLDAKKSGEIGGNIKYDVTTPENNPTSRFLSGSTYICLVSTRNGEEELLLKAIAKQRKKLLHENNLKFILAPRHVNRVNEIEKLLTSYSFTYSLYSEETQTGDEDFILVDCFGVLNECYAASTGAFIGGSLVKTGGQNLLEAIAHGIPIVFGSDMSNFKEESKYFLQHGAAQCNTADEVATTFQHWLQNPAIAQSTGTQLQKALDTHRGVTKRYAEKLLELIDRNSPPRRG